MYTNTFDPFTTLELLRNGVHNGRASALGESTASAYWPPVDIEEGENNYVITADVPGMTADDVEITVEEGLLRISGERAATASDGTSHRVERTHGRFSREFSLPDTADSSSVTAQLRDGVLRLSIAKVERAVPRKIAISAA